MVFRVLIEQVTNYREIRNEKFKSTIHFVKFEGAKVIPSPPQL